MGVFASNPAHGEGVPAIGSHVDLRGVVVETKQRQCVCSGIGVQAEPREHQDAVVVLAYAQLTHRGDHARRDVAVGLPRGDPEVSGQHCTRQRDDDFIAHGEIVGAADHTLHAVGRNALALQLLGLPLRHHSDLTPVDGLAVLLRLRRFLQDFPDDDRTAELISGTMHVLFLQPDRDQRGHQVLGRAIGGEAGVFTNPRQRDAHGLRPPIRSAG